jgi:quercetin dioxygenase-like cupin family protein
MSKLQMLKADSLSETLASPGIVRHLAFKDEGTRVLRAQSEPDTVSGWHHHGDYEVYGYVVSGTARFENGSEEKGTISVGPGEFFHVPSHTIHREINPSSTEDNDVILFLHGEGELVFNVDSPDKT